MSITDQEFIDQKNAQLHEYRETISTLTAKVKRYEEVLKYYADEMSYTVDSYEGISGEMRSRVVLYGDSDERNDVYSYAGRRARAALNQDDDK